MVGSEVASLVVPYSPEHRTLSTNDGLLRDLATLSGGTTPAEPAHNFTQNRKTARVWVEGWPYLLAMALALFLPDVALRRLRVRLPLGRGPSTRGGQRSSGPSSAGTASVGSAVPAASRFGSHGRR